MQRFTPDFDAWRVFRILSEFVNGFETMTDIGPSVSIFGSARVSKDHPYYQLGVDVARKIAEKGFAIITGGGPGIMEAANKGAQEAQGKSCGLSVNLPHEAENPHIDPKYRLYFRYFFVRKVMFIRYAMAFVVLPGGFGTLDELFEALTLIQTEKIRPFPIFVMGKSYWEGLFNWFKDTVIKEKNLSPENFDLVTLTDDPDEVADKIEKHYRMIKPPAPTFDLEKTEGDFEGETIKPSRI